MYPLIARLLGTTASSRQLAGGGGTTGDGLLLDTLDELASPYALLLEDGFGIDVEGVQFAQPGNLQFEVL